MKKSIRKFLPVFSLLIIFIINFVFIISTHLSWDNSIKKYLPLQREIKALKNNLSQAHLWFEEAISGDPYIDIEKDVMIPFSHQAFTLYIKNNAHILENVNDQAYLLSLKEIKIKLSQFLLLAQQRWMDSKKYGIGSELDQKFDSKFKILMNLIDTLSLQVQHRLNNEIDTRNITFSWIILCFLVLNIIVFSYLLFVRKREERYAHSLFEEKEKALITLRSIGDAVITTDNKGNVTSFNEMAEKLTEYKNSQVIGQYIDDVLNLYNVRTDQKIKTPISAVLHKGLTKLISNGSKLVSNSGKEYIISDSAAPVKDQQGNIYGTVLVFQDDTQKYAIDETLRQSEARYRSLVESIKMHYFFYTHNLDGIFTYVSESVENITGYSNDEFLTHYDEYLTNNPLNSKVEEYTQQSIKGLAVEPYHVELHHKNGSIVTLEVTEHPLFNEFHEVIAVEGIAKNITEQKSIESNLESLGNIINESLNEIYIFDKETLNFRYVNKAALNNIGYTLQEMYLLKPYDIKPEYSFKKFIKAVEPLSTSTGEKNKLVFETIHERKDGSQYPVEVHLQLIKNHDIDEYVAVILDRTEQKKAEGKLKYQTQYDALTQLPNRHLFIDRLQQAIKQSHRSHKKIAVLFIDLDRFKSINESLGHDVGDTMLKDIAEKLKLSVRETDSIARFGGDEFAVMLDRIDDASMINDIVKSIIKQISKPFLINGHQLYVTASIGISLYPLDGETPNILLRNADSAMYKAKDEGRNTYQYYTKEMTAQAFEHVLMESNLRHALENHEFIVYYQPQVCAEDNLIFGMEALVRWQHSELGLISPDKFIPLAEETGLIVPLGEEIFDIATKQIVTWMKDAGRDYRVAINLSVKQLQQVDIVEKLTNIMQDNECSPEWVELEVTEGYVMKNPELAIETLQIFSDMGIEIAIDDFGTGYSSLSYLKRLPINKLKIDQSFVRDISIDEDDKAIVESIIYLSKAMQLKVIAEGVETMEQKEFLMQQGCQEMQGYLYSKPVAATEMTELLQTKAFSKT